MKNCPICNEVIGEYHEVTFKEPYTHNIPFDGLHIYGPIYTPKKTICFENNFLHFAFYDAENNLVDHRLVQLGVENPTTKSPSEDYMEGMAESEDFEDEENEFEACSLCDGHDACEDFGCAFELGCGDLVENDDLPF